MAMSKNKRVALWIISGLLAALFLFAGLPKLLTPAKVGPMFVQFGYKLWFMTFIGICEVLGAIGLLVPRLAALAATGLSVIMAGAFVTLISHHQASQSITPLLVLAALVGIGYARFSEGRVGLPESARKPT